MQQWSTYGQRRDADVRAERSFPSMIQPAGNVDFDQTYIYRYREKGNPIPTWRIKYKSTLPRGKLKRVLPAPNDGAVAQQVTDAWNFSMDMAEESSMHPRVTVPGQKEPRNFPCGCGRFINPRVQQERGN